MAVGPRVSKEEFMNALGLSPQDELYYRAMRDEAINIYNIMNQDPSNLLETVLNDPTIPTRPPFFWHHIRPDRQRWGILEIWRCAKPGTKPLFDRGATNGEYGPNWVAGWLLYSVFRSRDIRNNRNRRKGEDGEFPVPVSGLSWDHCIRVGWVGSSRANCVVDKKQVEEPQPPVKKGYYDPVRNGTV